MQYNWYDFYKSNSRLEPKRGKLTEVVEGFVLKEEPVEVEYVYEYTLGNFFDWELAKVPQNELQFLYVRTESCHLSTTQGRASPPCVVGFHRLKFVRRRLNDVVRLKCLKRLDVFFQKHIEEKR